MLRWIHPTQAIILKKNSKNHIFLKYILIHISDPKFNKESEYRIHCHQKLTQCLLYSFF